MELKVKYHYSYFLNPFVIDDKKYESFIESIIKNQKWSYRIFDKIKDMEIFTHFLTRTKEMMFPSFYWSDKYKEKITQMNNEKCAKELAKQSCVEFRYNLNDNCVMQGKVDSSSQIFFEITEIKLVCFNSGICFLIFKANIDSDEEIRFRQLLNFNYKFKDVGSIYESYKPQSNIHIQTNQFENMQSVSNFIQSLTAGYIKLYNDDIYSDRMFVYSYACIDEENWNSSTNFEDLQNDFYKYVFQFSGDYNSDIILSKEEMSEVVYSKWKYSRYGFTKLGGVVFTSATDHFNFTKLPVDYEKVSLYIMLLAFYKRIALLVLNKKVTNAKMSEVNKIKGKVYRELIDTKFSQISNSSHGISLWKKWVKTFEIEQLYNEIDKEYTRLIKIVTTKRINMFLSSIIFILLLLFTFNLLG